VRFGDGISSVYPVAGERPDHDDVASRWLVPGIAGVRVLSGRLAGHDYGLAITNNSEDRGAGEEEEDGGRAGSSRDSGSARPPKSRVKHGLAKSHGQPTKRYRRYRIRPPECQVSNLPIDARD
jgi:hypothetical protein